MGAPKKWHLHPRRLCLLGGATTGQGNGWTVGLGCWAGLEAAGLLLTGLSLSLCGCGPVVASPGLVLRISGRAETGAATLAQRTAQCLRIVDHHTLSRPSSPLLHPRAQLPTAASLRRLALRCLLPLLAAPIAAPPHHRPSSTPPLPAWPPVPSLAPRIHTLQTATHCHPPSRSPANLTSPARPSDRPSSAPARRELVFSLHRALPDPSRPCPSLMPQYGAYGSPSLNKMENGYGHGQRSGFSLGRIFGDPFALATISIGSVSRSAAPRSSMRLLTRNSWPGSSPL